MHLNCNIIFITLIFKKNSTNIDISVIRLNELYYSSNIINILPISKLPEVIKAAYSAFKFV